MKAASHTAYLMSDANSTVNYATPLIAQSKLIRYPNISLVFFPKALVKIGFKKNQVSVNECNNNILFLRTARYLPLKFTTSTQVKGSSNCAFTLAIFTIGIQPVSTRPKQYFSTNSNLKFIMTFVASLALSCFI